MFCPDSLHIANNIMLIPEASMLMKSVKGPKISRLYVVLLHARYPHTPLSWNHFNRMSSFEINIYMLKVR